MGGIFCRLAVLIEHSHARKTIRYSVFKDLLRFTGLVVSPKNQRHAPIRTAGRTTLLADGEIYETEGWRSRVIRRAPTDCPVGRDATGAKQGLDLGFSPPRPFRGGMDSRSGVRYRIESSACCAATAERGGTAPLMDGCAATAEHAGNGAAHGSACQRTGCACRLLGEILLGGFAVLVRPALDFALPFPACSAAAPGS